jgi:hypothetical protein
MFEIKEYYSIARNSEIEGIEKNAAIDSEDILELGRSHNLV